MNKLLLTIIIFLVGATGFSQINKSSFNILIGPAFPTGKFASTNYDNGNVWYAKAGEYLKLQVTHLMNKNLGLSAQLQFERNPLNTSALENYTANTSRYGNFFFTDHVVNPPPPPAMSGPYVPWTIEKSSWFTASALVGGFVEFPFSNKKMSAFIDASVGVTYASTPRIHGNSKTDTSGAEILQASKSALGFAYSPSAGLRYALNAKTSIAFNIDYFGTANITFKNVQTKAGGFNRSTDLFTVPTTNWISGSTKDLKQSISSINLGLGVAFHF